MKLHLVDTLSICSPDDSIRTALKKLNSNQKGFIIIVNKQIEIIGIFTDGDAIRLMLNNNRLLADLFTDDISKVMNTKFIVVSNNSSKKEITSIFKTRKFNFIPVLNSDKKLLGVYTVYDFLENE
jgi:CBS domain-containing protein